MVRRGWLSHSTMPPWSPTILATRARPRPEPLTLVVTNGSKRWGRRSGGTPGPLSLMQTSSGRLTREAEPGTDSLTPGLKPVVKAISPSGEPSIASAAFLTRLRMIWTSWSLLA